MKRKKHPLGRVKVLDVTRDRRWYSAHVGEEFDVEEMTGYGYLVSNPHGSPGSYSIPVDDCEPSDLQEVIGWAEDSETECRVIRSWRGTELQIRKDAGWYAVDDLPAGPLSRLCARKIAELCGTIKTYEAGF